MDRIRMRYHVMMVKFWCRLGNAHTRLTGYLNHMGMRRCAKFIDPIWKYTANKALGHLKKQTTIIANKTVPKS